jgi:hypothetical protein
MAQQVTMRRGRNEQDGTPEPGSVARHRAALAATARWATLWSLAVRRWFNRPALRVLAANPGAPRLLLWLLAERRWDVQAMVAANPRCPRRVQASLVWSPEWAVRAALAANPATDPAVLEMLVGGSTACVRLHVAANPSLTPALADRLLGDSSPYVRAVAAGSTAASADGLRRLAEGMSEPAWALRAIAGNPSCPADLCDQLLTWIALGGSGDADALFDPVKCAGHPGGTRFGSVAWYREQARREGAESHPLWRVRAEVMPVLGRLPGNRARALSRDPRPEVRRTIARLPQLPPGIRLELMGDSDPQVARLALRGQQPGPARRRARLSWWRLLWWRLLPPLTAPLIFFGLLLWNVTTSQQATSGRSQPPYTRTVRAAAPAWRALPGHGGIACGMPPADGPGTSFVSVAAGSGGVTLHVAGGVMTAGGRVVDSPVAIPAGGWARFLLYGPASVSAAASRDGGSPAGASTTLLRCG